MVSLLITFTFTILILLLALGLSEIILLNSLQQPIYLVLLTHLYVLESIHTVHINLTLGVTREYDG